MTILVMLKLESLSDITFSYHFNKYQKIGYIIKWEKSCIQIFCIYIEEILIFNFLNILIEI